MKRPHLVHFLSIFSEDFISVKASVTFKESVFNPENELELFTPRFPIQNYKLLNANKFHLKFVGMNSKNLEIFQKSFESDNYGNFNFKIPLTDKTNQIKVWQVYEIGHLEGIELHLGSYIPLFIEAPKKFVICDFDKTLVDTRYSSTKDILRSLTQPLENFPTLNVSLDLLQDYIKKDFHPFILSASPHFYEDAIRDWLYQNGVYTAGIFLKDYRRVFNLFEGDLTPKDLKLQGLYKLNHLLDIISMAGIPDKLVLMGDNFESDPIIYLIFSKIIKGRRDPWAVWKKIKEFSIFKTSNTQNSQLLNKIYQLKNLKTRIEPDHNEQYPIDIKIYIRKKTENDLLKLPDDFSDESKSIELYTT